MNPLKSFSDNIVKEYGTLGLKTVNKIVAAITEYNKTLTPNKHLQLEYDSTSFEFTLLNSSNLPKNVIENILTQNDSTP